MPDELAIPAPSRGAAASTARWVALAGGVAGLAAALAFATAHALIIVPIWDRMAQGIAFAVLAGLAAGWAFAALGFVPVGGTTAPPRTTYALAGLRFGVLLWLAVAPVTLADTLLRLAGLSARYETVSVIVALALAVGAGALLGSWRGGSWRSRLAGAIATLMLTLAMAGPVPLPNGPRAVGIFLSVLPVCAVAGLVLGLVVRATLVRLPHGPSIE